LKKNIYTLLADEKLKIIFIAVSAIFSVEHLIPQKILNHVTPSVKLVMQM